MKAIDKNRFKTFLPAEEQGLGDAAGEVSSFPYSKALM